jgi:hypothetical protein
MLYSTQKTMTTICRSKALCAYLEITRGSFCHERWNHWMEGECARWYQRSKNMETTEEEMELTNEELIEQFEIAKKELKEKQKFVNDMKEKIMQRIQDSEEKSIEGKYSTYAINEINGLRVKGLKDIENEFGRKWLEEHRDRLTNDTVSYRIKVNHK